MCTSKLTPVQASAAVCSGTITAISWWESVRYLLDTLIIDDNVDEDTPEQRSIREETYPATGIADAPSFAEEEISERKFSLRRTKTPGLDNIDTNPIQGVWPVLHAVLTRLDNLCLSSGMFPDRWKHGRILAILKGKDKCDTDPTSYRPIFLLPVMGKLLEKLIKGRLKTLTGHMFMHQYGYVKGRTTIDAINYVKQITFNTPDKYALGIFVDVKGAFDRVWWTDNLKKLRVIRCQPNLYNLGRNYLSGRRVTIVEQALQHTKAQNRECAQGSVLGPLFWNLVFDSLLDRLAELPHCQPVAYADDLVIVVTGNSRVQIEDRAHTAIGALEEWCSDHRMLLSTEKTVGVLLKGKLNKERPPIIKIVNKRLRIDTSIKYLGVIIDSGFKFAIHPRYVAENARVVMSWCAALCETKWGISHREMSIIYRGSFVRTITYAAHEWIDSVKAVNIRKIISAHRCALMRVTKAYRTTSTDALEVIANIRPIVHEIHIEKLRYCARRNIPCSVLRNRYNIQDINSKDIIKQAIFDLTSVWNLNWQNSSKGRDTYGFFPIILERSQKDWVVPTYSLTQFLSGHGDFNDYLARRMIIDSNLCSCGSSETSIHVL